ncbi:probable E3 ubiquitin-protein ligase XERICO [Andrographis paniculata]|uniref:probable E3 ubiquitin-protein ligase XERICO n=1 Tax=Andrographis paniculata TaxID=175694 RepID=UPI0021E7CCE7|nr:probable E3 ubiquitin-protein ligase XERICO [Andrographis paniculata]
MGLWNFESPAEGVVPMLVMKTVRSVALVKNKLQSVLLAGGGLGDKEEEYNISSDDGERRVWVTRYQEGAAAEWCCVCLSRFKGDEEVSELWCKHLFHKACLDKWFHNLHRTFTFTFTCPLCRRPIT